MKAKALKTGDTIGVIAQSEPILEENKEDIQRAINLMQDLGINVKFAKHAYKNTLRLWRNSKK